MDLSSMLNGGPASAATKQTIHPPRAPSSASSRTEVLASGHNGHAANGHGNHETSQSSPFHRPPLSVDHRASSLHQDLTPLQTPSRGGSGSRHSFFPAPPPQQQQQHQYSQQLSQSPASFVSGQQRPHDSYAATTPGPRPLSHGGYAYAQPSPSQHISGLPSVLQHSTSHSPTPSSVHSQTPHSVRQSPLSFTPGPPPSAGHPSHHQSQPSTPLGPPSVHYHRTSNHSSHQDIHSPYHSRTLSGTSSNMNTASPAQHHLSIGNLVDMPNVSHRQSPHVSRRTSDYLNQLERERTLSVSPKTKVPLHPSLSRHSSQPETYSSRSSLPPHAALPTEASSQMLSYSQPGQQGVPPATRPDIAIHHASGIVAAPLQSQHTRSAASSNPSLTPLSTNGGTHAVQHHAQKMDMNHLLTPTSEVPPTATKSHEVVVARDPTAHPAMHPPPPATPGKRSLEDIEQGSTRKQEGPALKKTKRKYATPPIWARMHPANPLSKGQAPQHTRPQQSHTNGIDGGQPQLPAPNRLPTNEIAARLNVPPWQQDPPLDMDLIEARLALNGPWEKSFKWNQPYIELHGQVLEFLQGQLASLSDVGNDPSEGAIEIEAKFGHIIAKASDMRMSLPVKNACVLDPAWCEMQTRFESRMDQAKHQRMNEYLNARTQESHSPGRLPMRHSHPKEVDSFRTLSSVGVQALPQAFQRRGVGREPRLRTTVDSKSGQVTARIVKVALGSLHIFNPNFDYDCRITVNLEVNLNRPDLHPDDLTIAATETRPAPPDRKKDRLSYKHLAYSIDLTRVDTPGMDQPKYELELEVDGSILRHHFKLRDAGQRNAAMDIVSGFVDNATFLMRGAN
nr:mrna-capping enzyme subunit beta [Quercus suber]